MSDTEPKRYAWIRDGLLVAGTLRDYAKMWEGDYYAGDSDLTRELLAWDGVKPPTVHAVRIQRREMTESDYLPYEFTVNGETAFVQIDGRA